MSETPTYDASDERQDRIVSVEASEAARNEAERKKIELESEEIRARLKWGRFGPRFLLEVVLGALVASGLVAAWFITYLNPILSAKRELGELGVKIQELKLEQVRLENERQAKQIEAANQALQKQLQELSTQNSKLEERQAAAAMRAKELEERLSQRSDELRKIAQDLSLTERDKQRLEQLASITQADAEQVQEQLATLQADRESTVVRGRELERSLTKLELAGTTWKLTCETLCENFAFYYVTLRSDGVFGINVKAPDNFTFRPDNQWTIRDSKLEMSWSGGYAKYQYSLNQGLEKLSGFRVGTKSIRGLERVL